MPASSKTEITRKLRRNSTDAEKRMWRELRDQQLGGAKFRRQHPIGPYIVDFCCLERRVVVELDGGQHAVRSASDQRRDRWFETQGYQVLRIWNHEVMANIEGALRRILEVIGDPDEYNCR